MADPRVLIIGAGPTGLGAARRLAERGHENWLLLEQASGPGGLSSSVVDKEGFTWDMGGHVLFSHYPYFDEVMDEVVPEWLEHEREAWVWIRDRWVPYPLQNNIWRLPDADAERCIRGLRGIQGADATPPASFDEWLRGSFGQGLYDLFMLPYNRKVWGYHPSKLGVGWMGERVAAVDVERVIRNVEAQRDDISWGPNATFRFPLRGGTGAIWKGVAAALPADRLRYGSQVVGVDTSNRVVTLSDGNRERYDTVLSTMPLDALLGLLTDQPELSGEARHFVHSSTHVVGIGIEGEPPEHLRTRCWMYFPEDSSPFYRCTVFSNYSPHNVPEPGRTWSLMAEVAESPDKPVDASRVVEETLEGMRASSLLPEGARVVSRFHRRLPYGYPTPWLERDEVLWRVQPRLAELGILSRGRFGAWKYEVSNQDHSLMQGVEAVDHCLDGSPEKVLGERH